MFLSKDKFLDLFQWPTRRFFHENLSSYQFQDEYLQDSDVEYSPSSTSGESMETFSLGFLFFSYNYTITDSINFLEFSVLSIKPI